ncbi:MAG TPA: hypothetical protein VJ806_14970 [Luteimonas sp.]|nr:hypothetical protein [Luteimonas sp.]
MQRIDGRPRRCAQLLGVGYRPLQCGVVAPLVGYVIIAAPAAVEFGQFASDPTLFVPTQVRTGSAQRKAEDDEDGVLDPQFDRQRDGCIPVSRVNRCFNALRE